MDGASAGGAQGGHVREDEQYRANRLEAVGLRPLGTERVLG